MAKGNRSRKQVDFDGVNKNFDTMIKDFAETAVKCEKVMPLVSTSLLLTVELIKTYKNAFNSVAKKE